MSWQPTNDPVLGDPKSCDALELVIVPRTRDLGDGFEVRRALPHGKRQMVGPFIFFDHFGPVQFVVRQGHGRAAASAYRAGHRHLSVRRQHHAPRSAPSQPHRELKDSTGCLNRRRFYPEAVVVCCAALVERLRKASSAEDPAQLWRRQLPEERIRRWRRFHRFGLRIARSFIRVSGFVI